MTRKLLLLLLMMAFLSACGGTPPEPTLMPTFPPDPTAEPTSTLPPQPTSLPSVLELTRADDPSQQAFVRVIHAAPNLPTVDIFIERLAIGTNMNFADYTEPTAIVAGNYFLRMLTQGSRPDDAEAVLFETPIAIQGQESLMLMFTGNPEAIIMSTYHESNEPLDSHQSRVTAIHAIERGPAFAVQQDVVTLTGDLVFGEASNTITLESGDTALNFQSGPNALVSYTEPLAPRTAYTFIVTGQPEDLENLILIPIRASVPGKVSLRAVNASSEMNNLDVYINGTLFAAELQYPRATERQSFITDNYTVEVYPAGTSPEESAPITSAAVFGADDDAFTIIFTGPIDDFRIVSYRDDLSQTPNGQARIAFITPLNYINQVHVTTPHGPLEEIGNLRYAEAPRPIHVNAGPQFFIWVGGNSLEETQVIESTDEVILDQGLSYLHILSGRSDMPPIFISENVGFEATTINPEEIIVHDPLVDATPAPQYPTRVRFINAITGGQPVDFLINNEVFATNLDYSQHTDYLEAPNDQQLAEVRLSGGDAPLGQTQIMLTEGQAYTLIAYGEGTQFAALLLVEDAPLAEYETDAPLLRLINLTVGGAVRFGLAQSAANPDNTPSRFSEAPQPQIAEATEEGQEAPVAIYRRSLAFGITPFANMEPVNSMENVITLAPIGLHDIHILDTSATPTTIAGSIRQINFEPDTLYEIIAFQERGSTLVHAFVIPQPRNQP